MGRVLNSLSVKNRCQKQPFSPVNLNRQQVLVQNQGYGASGNVKANEEEGGTMSYEDLIDAFKHEKEELKKLDKSPGEMGEDDLKTEQDFVYSEYIREDDPNCDGDNHISFTFRKISSFDSSSTLSPNEKTIDSSVVMKEDETLNTWLSGLQDFL